MYLQDSYSYFYDFQDKKDPKVLWQRHPEAPQLPPNRDSYWGQCVTYYSLSFVIFCLDNKNHSRTTSSSSTIGGAWTLCDLRPAFARTAASDQESSSTRSPPSSTPAPSTQMTQNSLRNSGLHPSHQEAKLWLLFLYSIICIWSWFQLFFLASHDDLFMTTPLKILK